MICCRNFALYLTSGALIAISFIAMLVAIFVGKGKEQFKQYMIAALIPFFVGVICYGISKSANYEIINTLDNWAPLIGIVAILASIIILAYRREG